jgi:hypothetical protein
MRAEQGRKSFVGELLREVTERNEGCAVSWGKIKKNKKTSLKENANSHLHKCYIKRTNC